MHSSATLSHFLLTLSLWGIMVSALRMGIRRLRWGWVICSVTQQVSSGARTRSQMFLPLEVCILFNNPALQLPQDHMQVHQLPLILSALEPHQFPSNSLAFLQTLSEVSAVELRFNYVDSDQTEGCPHAEELGGPCCIGQLEYLSPLFDWPFLRGVFFFWNKCFLWTKEESEIPTCRIRGDFFFKKKEKISKKQAREPISEKCWIN